MWKGKVSAQTRARPARAAVGHTHQARRNHWERTKNGARKRPWGLSMTPKTAAAAAVMNRLRKSSQTVTSMHRVSTLSIWPQIPETKRTRGLKA
ncbi:hypothetical protein D3C86_1448870 [compost metagenome]